MSCENNKQITQQYTPGNLVILQCTRIIPNLSLPRMGAYTVVVTAHDNGNVTIQKEACVTNYPSEHQKM